MNQELLNEINVLLEPDPSAKEFILKWTEYVHLIDDMVDGDAPMDPLKLTAVANDVYTTTFYRRYAETLWSVVQLTNNTYGDSVEWEKSGVKWKKIHAGALRHTGLDMFFIVVRIVAGYEAMRKLSARMREYSHKLHIKDENFHPEVLE